MVRKVFTSAGRHGFPTDDPILLADRSDLLVHLSLAPVVALHAGPVGRDVACAPQPAARPRHSGPRPPRRRPGALAALRDLFGRCRRHAQDIYRTRTRAAT
nr:hypothetical protein GCM10017745_83710 [Saccharothrix mutabilis subsp. capreolus]